MESVEIAQALFEALTGKDDQGVRKLCAPHLRARHNNGAPMNLETLLAFSASVHRVLKDFRYSDAVRSATSSGFVEEHSVTGILPNGITINLAVCVVADVSDGKVTDLREYFDTAAAADLIAALGAQLHRWPGADVCLVPNEHMVWSSTRLFVAPNYRLPDISR